MTSTQIMKPSDEAKIEADERPVGGALDEPDERTAIPPAIPARPNQSGIFRARHAASEEPMITEAAHAAAGPEHAVSPRARRRLQREERAAREHDDPGEEAVRVVADDAAREQARNQRKASPPPMKSAAAACGCVLPRASASSARGT